MIMLRRFLCGLTFAGAALAAWAQAATPAANTAAEHDAATNAAAAAMVTHQVPRTPDFLESVMDEILQVFDVRAHENTVTHFVIAGIFLIGALLLRRVVTSIIFGYLRKLAARTTTTLDDKLFPALEPPVATFIMLLGIFAALNVLKLPPGTERFVDYGATIAFSLTIFWGLLRALGALLDHAQEIALNRQMGVAAFMPWIKKTLISVFVVIGVLMVVQSIGYDVKALLAGLGIGGLAFALAAQDTIANLFGSIVVAIDQPFRVGEAVKIGASEGVVEDIGLRSTKLRTPGRNLIIIPNKTVAAEAIINNSRFTGRRVEQVFGLSYDATAQQMQDMVTEIRGIITGEAEVDVSSVLVFFRDFNASSLDIWVAYNVKNPDFAKHMELRQRVNLAIMRAVEAKGLSFAYPTQTLHIASTPESGDGAKS